MCQLGIHKTRTAACQSDGMIESNKSTRNATFVQGHQKDRDLHLPLLLMSYHSDDQVYPCNAHVRVRIECALGSAFGVAPS